MDYDGDDISCHNIQLTGDSRSKSSSVFRPYDFPKFDLDDSLQAHLRFDNLVETEVFLGIQSQEDNQWIEDFSRGSNGMEFNSTPADSCSIPKRNNVWSEATSSESVEMLLKSVGQEEMMPGQSIIPESSAGRDENTLANLVEPSGELDTKCDESHANSETTIPLGKPLIEPSLKGHEEQLPEAEEPPVTHENVESVCGKGVISTSEGSHSYHNESVEPPKSSANNPENFEAGEGPLQETGVHDDVNTNPGAPSASEISELVNADVSHENCIDDEQGKYTRSGTVQEVPKIYEGMTGEASINVNPEDCSVGLVAESGVLNSQDAVDANHAGVVESADIETTSGFEVKVLGDEKNVPVETSSLTGKHEVEASSLNDEIAGSVEDCADKSLADDTDQHLVEPSVIPEQHMDSSVLLTCKQDSGNVEEIQGSSLKGESTDEVPLFSVDDKKIAEENSDYIDIKSSGIVVLSATADKKETEITEGCHSNFSVAIGNPDTNLPTAALEESKHGIEESLGRYLHHLPETEQVICKTKGNKNLRTECGIVVAENVKNPTSDRRTQSVDLSEGVKGNDVIHDALHHSSGTGESVNDATPHAKSNISAEGDDGTENGSRKPAVMLLSASDHGDDGVASRIASSMNFGTEVVAKIGVSPVASAFASTPLSELGAKSPRTVAKGDDISCSGFPKTEDINSEYSDHSHIHVGCDKSSFNESCNADLVGGGILEVASAKVEMEKESTQSAEVDKASCGSPTIISSSEPSQLEKDIQEEVRGAEIRNQFVKVQPVSEDLKQKDVTGDDSTFTFKVNALPVTSVKDPGKTWSPFPNVEKCNSSMVVEEIKLPGEGKTAKTPSQKTPRQSAKVSDGEHVHGTSKGTSERKARRASTKGMAKETSKKGNQVRDTNQESAKGDNVSNPMLSASSSGPHTQFGTMQLYKHAEQSISKVSGAAAVPDLNNSASNSISSPSTSFRQPFTDLQQVQLRAQIFVYGSLIQGTAPDEACMVSAFGSSDGRSIWESVWRSAVERVRGQKSVPGSVESPLLSQSGARASDAAVKQSLHSSKVLVSPVARVSSKGTPTTGVNPIIPLSSPLWSISTPSRDDLPSSGLQKGSVVEYQHAVAPLHSYQTPPVRNFVGHTSWPSQSCFPGSWLASPQASTFNSSVHFPVTVTETVKLTPVKDISGPVASSMKHVTSGSPIHSVGPSPAHVGSSSLSLPKVIVSTEPPPVDSKTRKRKKVQSPNPDQVSLPSEAQTEAVVDSNMASILPSPVVLPLSSSPAPVSPVSNAVLSNTAPPTVAFCYADQSKKGDLDAGKTVSCSEETLSRVAEAKSQAENAAAFAAAAVSHGEDLWRQFAKQKESGQTSEVEAKLVSAAAAISAAVSVAKAAAAAAMVASNVALQAKLMADEAFHSEKTSVLIHSGGKYSADMHDVGSATPASILKGDNITNHSSSILVVAKEAAKRRVEAASAAAKQAENLDAIVKAAELAAAAVSQAGKIVAMGEPLSLSLSELLEAGPGGYRSLTQPTSDLVEKLRGRNRELSGVVGVEDSADISAKGFREDFAMRGGKTIDYGNAHLRERSNDGFVDGTKKSMHTGVSDLRSGQDIKGSEARYSGVGSEPDKSTDGDGAQNDHDELMGTFPQDGIKEGSAVEVFKHGDGLKSAWYSANVLTLEDGKAYICYTDLASKEGSGNLCEWVFLKGEGNKAPVIRAAHPLTALQFQGTRKRRRAALGDYAWCVGDKVDVWIDDCWWEGVVTEKNEKDETTLKVHFPAQGETSTVRAWNLRSSRLWNDGKWVEWFSKGHSASEQSDTPQEKRQKFGSVAVPSKQKGKLANDVDSSGKPEESKLLDLSTSDRIFDVGKTTKEDNKRVGGRPLRSGLQKEGSRVVFGVPKPTGKKRKFMEVSKHFPATRSDKNSETNDSVKFAKYLMPQATAGRGWKVPSRNDSKEKRTAEPKPRVPSFRKSNRTVHQADNINLKDRGKGVEDSTGLDEDSSGKIPHGSSVTGEAAEAPLSSLIFQSSNTSLKKISSGNSKPERRLLRGKQAPSAGKFSKIEEDKALVGNADKSVPDVAEPRRSNRRIQPTHRLLEGLQSSMVIPKLPSVSHDRVQRNPSRNVFARGK